LTSATPARAPARLTGVLEASYPHFLALVIVAAAAWAWEHRFVLDDAYISFRYAANLAAGNGLVWNPGERVEGYTNFLWTLVLAIPEALRIDPLILCFVAGPLMAAATLWLTARMSVDLLGSKPLALLVVALVGINPTFAAFATGGLETAALTLVVTAIVGLAVRRERWADPGPAQTAPLSLLAAAALMLRLDSVVIVAPMMALVAWSILQGSVDRRRRGALAMLVAPAAAFIGAWFLWRAVYYGSLLPNSFAVRRMGPGAWQGGFTYLGTFLGSYLLWPTVVLLVAALVTPGRRPSGGIAALLVLLAIEYVYVASVGGDFMEFRFLVPTLPILFLLVVWVSCTWVRQPIASAVLIGIVLLGVAHHVRTFVYKNGIESVWLLTAHLFDTGSDWIGVGRKLGETFRDAPDVRIGVTAAGAIPYYAGLPCVDMLGINDPWVARNGLPMDGPPGHNHLAPLGYLVERGVNLVLGHPIPVPPSLAGRTAWAYDELSGLAIAPDPTPDALPAEATILEIPLDPGRVFLALYLVPHPAVNAAIAAGGWKRLPIDRSPPQGG
jgi:arabinofuranosyltransferase